MRKIKDIIKLGLIAIAVYSFSSCTDLDEAVYSSVMSDNYYRTKQDIINAVFRPFEGIYSTVNQANWSEECCADQLITPSRGTWWVDGGVWAKFHRHQYDDLVEERWNQEWNSIYLTIAQANVILDDLNRLSPDHFGFTGEEWDGFKGQLRCIRAYQYLRLLNVYRYAVLCTSSDQAINKLPENQKQVEPKILFNFIEKELTDCLSSLPTKNGQSGNGIQQGQCTKAFAAGLLVRLYLNAEKWIGEAKWNACEEMCARITKGDFGYYAVAQNWYEAFDWNNDTSNEVIFAFPSSYGMNHWHMLQNHRTVYGRSMPYGSANYLDIEGDGERNPQFALSPSYDNQNPPQLFTYELGMVTQKFLKYPGDVRYKQYKNTSNKSREGMFFLEGRVPNARMNGGYAYDPFNQYVIYLRDQVGRFEGKAPEGIISNLNYAESKYENGDFNSGLYCVKYPFYSFTGGYFAESDYTIMRLPEIIYSQAECLIRLNRVDEGGKLLNSVRKRNYEVFSADIAYKPEGNVKIDLKEMLDEWGREFLNETRRRTDLIRFGRFQEEWWDKPKDKDDHYELFPIPQKVLEQNKYLKQNPGYPDIIR